MTLEPSRYDTIADGYRQWWAPVLAPAAYRLLDAVDEFARSADRIIDIGTGTGTLALSAVRRWRSARVEAIDASSGMAAVATREADRVLEPGDRARLDIRTGVAAALPVDDASVDLAVSSFVFQLVPNRAAALRDARRVLRPGGMLGFVTWLRDDRPFAPDAAFDDAIADIGLEPREYGSGSDDLESVDATARQLRRAGFRHVHAEPGGVEWTFDPDSYIGFLSGFDEMDLFAELDADVRRRLIHRMRARFASLSADDFVLRLPVVFAFGRRP